MARWGYVLALCLLMAGCAPPPTAGVVFPSEYRASFVHYATIARADGKTRQLYIDPSALSRYRAGGALPDGTVIVIEGHLALRDAAGALQYDSAGRLLSDEGKPLEMVHIAEKRAHWREEDFVDRALRIGGWNFGSYDYASGERFAEDLLACFNCHQAAPQDDFIYSRPLLDRYARSGDVQYIYCDLPGRVACDF